MPCSTNPALTAALRAKDGCLAWCSRLAAVLMCDMPAEYIHKSTKSREQPHRSIADRLRRVLTFKRLSIREFSAQTGVPYSTLQSYLGGTRRPAADHLVAIASTGIDIHWLLTGQLRPPLRLDFPSEDWSELAERVGALPGELLIELSDLAYDVVDQFAKRRASPLTARQTCSAVVFCYLMALRSALGIAYLVAATTKTKPKATEVRAAVAATFTPAQDAAIEDSLQRLV